MTAGAVAAVLAIALVVGFQLNERQQNAARPSASPSSSNANLPYVDPRAAGSPTTTPTPAVSASPAAGEVIYNDDFGFIVTGGDGVPHASIRKESVNTGNGTQLAPQALAVSPDGRQIAFWAMYTATPELHLLSVSDGAERTLVTLAADQRGGGVAWSNDSAAILYSVDTGCGICPTGPVVGATLNIYELAAGGRHGTTIDTQTKIGWYRPIAWDRSTSLAAAGIVAEGGGMVSYVTLRTTPGNTSVVQRADTGTPGKLGILMQSVRASTDAKFVLGVDFESSDIKWWPLADFAANKTQAGAGKRGALWRPGTHQIGYIAPDGHAATDPFWLGNVDTAGQQQLCCVAFAGVPSTARIETFRADGSAVLIGAPVSNAYLADHTLVRFGSDPKATSGDRVTFQDLSGILGSVRFR